VAKINEQELSLELVGRLNCLSYSLWWLQTIQITSVEKPFEMVSSWKFSVFCDSVT